MASETMSATDLVNLLKSCKAVQSIGAWGEGNGQRWYLNLWDASRTFRGDQSAKWYVDVRGQLNHVPGQGTRSPAFRESVEILNDFCAENSVEIRKVL